MLSENQPAECGKAALGALEKAIEEYKAGLIDVIVTAPINKHTIQSEEFSFPGQDRKSTRLNSSHT